MAVPKRKTSKSNTKMRRAANSKMVATGFVSCPQCHEPKLPHRVCPDCGYYKGITLLLHIGKLYERILERRERNIVQKRGN